jgi:hypothetical protein
MAGNCSIRLTQLMRWLRGRITFQILLIWEGFSVEAPLAIIVQSGSAAGKTSLMEAVLAFLPEEQRVQYSAMTGRHSSISARRS